MTMTVNNDVTIQQLPVFYYRLQAAQAIAVVLALDCPSSICPIVITMPDNSKGECFRSGSFCQRGSILHGRESKEEKRSSWWWEQGLTRKQKAMTPGLSL